MADEETIKSEGRNANGRFAVGNPGGPGRPVGSGGVPQLRAAFRKLWLENRELYAKKMDEMLRDGDPNAWKLMMERGDPVVKEQLHEHIGDVNFGWKGERPAATDNKEDGE